MMIYPPSVMAELESDAAAGCDQSKVLLLVANWPAESWQEFLPMLLGAAAAKTAEVVESAPGLVGAAA